MQELINWLCEPLHLLDAFSTMLGLVYLYLEYKASIWLWLAGVIMPAVHSVVYLKAGLYADFGMEFFYVAVAVYGFWAWKFGKKEKGKSAVPITHISRRMLIVAAVAMVAVWVALYFLLSRVFHSTVPVLDGFTTAMSIVAYWALARKWAEQWLMWLVVDFVCTGLYIYKGIPFSGCLYGFYTVMAVVGYRKWLKLMKGQV